MNGRCTASKGLTWSHPSLTTSLLSSSARDLDSLSTHSFICPFIPCTSCRPGPVLDQSSASLKAS